MAVRDDLGNLCDRRIRLNFIRIAKPVIDEWAALRYAQQVFGPYGICVAQGWGGYCAALSEADAKRLRYVEGDCQSEPASEEHDLLFSIKPRLSLPSDITVYCVQGIREAPKGSYLVGRQIAGCSVHPPGRPAVMIAATNYKWVLPHELGHVLLRSAGEGFPHSTDKNNVMYGTAADITGDPPVLNKYQAEAMRRSPYCHPC